MATYKKRGFKNKASSSKAEALEKKSTTANVFNTLDEGSSQTQQWVERNQVPLSFSISLAAMLIVLSRGHCICSIHSSTRLL